MDTFYKFILTILTLLILIQFIYSFMSFSKFNCPDCPICPRPKECSELYPPSSNQIVKHIHKTLIIGLEDAIDGIKFLNENVVFANNIKIKFEVDSESILIKMRPELIDNKKNISVENMSYVQSNDINKKKDFNNLFNLSSYPSPLIKFKNTDILFGWIDKESKWKMLINKDKY